MEMIRPMRLCKLPSCFQHVNPMLSPWRPYVTRVRGPNNVGRAGVKRIQRRCATLRRSRNKRSVGSLSNFVQQLPTTRNNMQQVVQKNANKIILNNVGICWPTMVCPFARGFRQHSLLNLDSCLVSYI